MELLKKEDVYEDKIKKILTSEDIKYGAIEFIYNFSGTELDMTIIDKANKQKYESILIKINHESCRIGNLKELLDKHYVKVGDIAKLYIDIDNKQISVEFVNIEVKTLTFIESRNQVIVALNLKLLKNAGYEPGSRVNIVYCKDTIIIENLKYNSRMWEIK